MKTIETTPSDTQIYSHLLTIHLYNSSDLLRKECLKYIDFDPHSNILMDSAEMTRTYMTGLFQEIAEDRNNLGFEKTMESLKIIVDVYGTENFEQFDDPFGISVPENYKTAIYRYVKAKKVNNCK